METYKKSMLLLKQYIKQTILMAKSSTIKTIKTFDKCNYNSIYSSDVIQYPYFIPNGEFIEKKVNWFGKENLKIAVMETNYGYFIQPREHYYKYQFEEYFGFGYGNVGYCENKTIYVPFKSVV